MSQSLSMTKLFLDDVRDPPDASWAVARSFEAFKTWIIRWGVPDLISFDHDLGDGVPSGMDCAKWLVEEGHPLKDFKVHSANPPGRQNILALLANYKQHLEAPRQLRPGTRIRILADGEKGRPVSIWLVSVGLFPPEKHMGKEGVLDKPNFELCVLDAWGAAHMSAVRLDGENIPRFVPNPALEFLGG